MRFGVAHPTRMPTAHRPWPPPARPWVIRMRWRDLLFMHWPVEPAVLRPHIPAGLGLDTFDGSAWLGVVPFLMDIRPRLTPPIPIPRLTRFPELNVRTYVTTQGKPGVWFFSLDAQSRIAVAAARRFVHLPYFYARMFHRRDGEDVIYISTRTHADAPPASLTIRYRPVGGVYHATPGSLDHFLTERYCLYAAAPLGQLQRGEIHHPPWPLQPATCEIEQLDMTRLIGIASLATPAKLYFASCLHVIAWSNQAIDPG